MQLFLKPLFSELSNLATHGIQINSPFYQNPFVSKVILLAGTCDLPAKCLVLNTTQFNGKFGCNKCLQPGRSHLTSARGHTHVYPYSLNDPTGPKCSKEQHYSDAAKAAAEKNTVNGVKGPSWLMTLHHYDIIQGTAVDYMHCVLLGVMKLLLTLWFGSEHKRSTFYIGGHLSLVDQRIKEIKTLSAISHTPQTISQHFKYFKASEYRAFLLYYSLPVLAGVLPPQFWNHYSLLVTAISILLRESISEREIDYCQTLLKKVLLRIFSSVCRCKIYVSKCTFTPASS